MGLNETAGSPKYRRNDMKPRLFCVHLACKALKGAEVL